jgi:hypothetical protein
MDVWVTWQDAKAGRDRTAEITRHVTQVVKATLPAGMVRQVWVTVCEQPNGLFCGADCAVGELTAEEAIDLALWGGTERIGDDRVA